MAILGWASLLLIALGLTAVALGFYDMDNARIADAKMGGAIFVMLGGIVFVVGGVLGIIWLAVT